MNTDFATLESRKDNWDDRDSKAPKLKDINLAKGVLIEVLLMIIRSDKVWITPFISSDEDGYVTVQWNSGKHELHLEIQGESVGYIKVWGVNIETHMFVGTGRDTDFYDSLGELWLWLEKG